jgi:hypothetical protein
MTMMNTNALVAPSACHPERSEGSKGRNQHDLSAWILRFAQNDAGGDWVPLPSDRLVGFVGHLP